MKKIWEHAQLGRFKFDTDCEWWAGSCELPSFARFTWERDEDDAEQELRFETDEGAEPTAAAVALAQNVIKNEAALAALVPSVLFNEFTGRGPKSGMWWHGNMDQVAENFSYDDRPAPKGPDDLLPAMRLSSLTIRERSDEFEIPVAELRFQAVFEEEHGIGILTDGKRIVGTGYCGDVTPFESKETIG